LGHQTVDRLTLHSADLIPISNKKTTDSGEPEWMEPLPVEHYPLSPSKASVTPSKQIGITNKPQYRTKA
jgi:hypothetical protein